MVRPRKRAENSVDSNWFSFSIWEIKIPLWKRPRSCASKVLQQRLNMFSEVSDKIVSMCESLRRIAVCASLGRRRLVCG